MPPSLILVEHSIMPVSWEASLWTGSLSQLLAKPKPKVNELQHFSSISLQHSKGKFQNYFFLKSGVCLLCFMIFPLFSCDFVSARTCFMIFLHRFPSLFPRFFQSFCCHFCLQRFSNLETPVAPWSLPTCRWPRDIRRPSGPGPASQVEPEHW